MHLLAKFHADQRPLRRQKVKKTVYILRHFGFINLTEKFKKRHFSRAFLHEIWHIYRGEGALLNDAKVIQTGYCFQGHNQGKRKLNIAFGVDLEMMSN